jgi:hypothetical protein
VGQQDDLGAGVARGFDEQAMPRHSGRCGQTGRGFVANPALFDPVDAQGGAGVGANPAPVAADRVQSMIDRNRQQPTATRSRPVCSQLQQGHGVAATGQADNNWMVDISHQPGVETRLKPFDQTGGSSVQVQRACVRIWPAMVFSCAEAAAP